VRIWFVPCLVGLTVVPVHCSRKNAGDGNVPVTLQRCVFFHHYCGCNSAY